jgi:CRP-like cAMP-binding protein
MLPEADFCSLAPLLSTVELEQGRSLAQAGSDIKRVYFPYSGIVSFMVEVENGEFVQTAMVGRDGVVGAAQALEDKLSINKIVVQLPSTASVIDRDALRAAIGQGNAIRGLLAAHEQFLLAQVQQTAACNALHSIEERMARWMLRMRNLVGTDVPLPLTQEYLAVMIGVRRTSVSLIASRLQTAGLISYARGQIYIEDLKGLEDASCACHKTVTRNYQRLFRTKERQ